MTVDVLCRVVDNFGDIGVVFRLCRALRDADPALRIRLVVDNLAAFRALEPAVDPDAPVQAVRGWTVVRWNEPGTGGRETFRAERPRLVLECFACGRPDWFEEIIFDPADTGTTRIVDLEYLTAEEWADDFHRIPGLTRSARVKKCIFMPGFSDRTGGLIIDAEFAAARERYRDPAGRTAGRLALLEHCGAGEPPATYGAAGARPGATRAPATGPAHGPRAQDGLLASAEAHRPGAAGPAAGGQSAADLAGRFWVSVFSYERDYTRIVADLAAFAAGRPLLALVAAGKGSACFLAAWEAAGRPFPVLPLPFLGQETWDRVILAADFAIVRGEDSLSRAALAGIPFLWQAYPQAGRQQLVKVRALLERLRPFLAAGNFTPVAELFAAFNDRDADTPGTRGGEDILAVLGRLGNDTAAPAAGGGTPGEGQGLAAGFAAFGDSLMARGDLAGHLLTFLRDFV